MCGIFGVIGKKIEHDEAEKCLDTLIHRGPDAGRILQEADVTI